MKQFDTVPPTLGVQHTTDVLAGLGFDQRNLQTHHVLIVTIESPIDHPG